MQAQRLLEHVVRVGQPWEVLGADGPRAHHRVYLFVEALLHLGVLAYLVEDPGQGGGRGLRPGEQDRDDLVPDLLGAHPRTRVGVHAGQEQGEQVVPVFLLFAVLRDHLVDDPAQAGGRRVELPVRRDGQQVQGLGHHRP